MLQINGEKMRDTDSKFTELGIDRILQDNYICNFKAAIKDVSNSYEKIIDKYLLFGTPYVFNDDEDKFYEFKSEIANFFNVSQTNIFVVGSAKLGFSIAPQKRYTLFNLDSDIDIAIIDGTLFLSYWKKLYKYNTEVRARSSREEENYREFLKYFFKGWLRPDKFPSTMNEKKEWFDFFKSLQGKYKYRIAAGIYYDIDVFIGYNRMNLESIREEINNG